MLAYSSFQRDKGNGIVLQKKDKLAEFVLVALQTDHNPGEIMNKNKKSHS